MNSGTSNHNAEPASAAADHALPKLGRLDTLVLCIIAFALVALNGRPSSLNSAYFCAGGLCLLWANALAYRRSRFTLSRLSTPVTALWLLWLFAATLSVVMNPDGGLEMLVNWSCSYLLPFLMLFTLAGRRITFDQAEIVIGGLALGIVVRFSYALVVFYETWGIPKVASLVLAHFNLFRILPYENATFGNTGNTASLISPLTVLMVLAVTSLRLSLSTFIVVVLALLVLLLNGLITGSRAFVFVTAVTLALASLKLNLRWALPVLLAIVGAYAFLTGSLGAENLGRFGAVATTSISKDRSLVERTISIETGLRTMVDNAFGVGPGMSYLHNAYSVAHQFAVSQGAELGFIGFSATIALAAVVVISALRVKYVSGDGSEFVFKFAALSWLIFAMTANTPTGFGAAIPWIGTLALFVALGEMTRNDRTAGSQVMAGRAPARTADFGPRPWGRQ